MLYGLDIGGTKSEFAAFDSNLCRVHTHRIATPTQQYRKFMQAISDVVVQADQQFGSVGSLGVGLPGIVDRLGRSFSANVPCLKGRNVKVGLARLLKRPVAIINDGRAFALSEANGGAAQGYDRVIGAILGTGAVGGNCIRGRLHTGRDGVAGEWGHLPIAATVLKRHKLPLYECGCGASGCIECYVSGPGLSRIFRHFADSDFSAREIVNGVRAGEPLCVHVFEVWLDCLASCFAQLILHVNPDIIVIGGGLSRIPELYDRLPQVLLRHLFGAIEPPPIAPAKYGDASGVRGAAIIGAQDPGIVTNSVQP